MSVMSNVTHPVVRIRNDSERPDLLQYARQNGEKKFFQWCLHQCESRIHPC